MSLVDLQNKIGAAPDGAFGPNTLKRAMGYYHLTPDRAAHFFAQTAHETGDFKVFSENLNYSAEGLLKIFGKYFPTNTLAGQYERQPQKIANRVYSNRMGNGGESSGDGFLFRGRGALQITGRVNYKAFSDFSHRPDVITNPDILAGELAFESALWFFDNNSLWSICDQGVADNTILSLTKKINGGTNGLDDRKVKTKLYRSWL